VNAVSRRSKRERGQLQVCDNTGRTARTIKSAVIKSKMGAVTRIGIYFLLLVIVNIFSLSVLSILCPSKIYFLWGQCFGEIPLPSLVGFFRITDRFSLYYEYTHLCTRNLFYKLALTPKLNYDYF